TGFVMGLEQGIDFTAYIRIAVACVVEIRRTIVRRERDSLLHQLLDALPALGIHAGASPLIARYSHARAIVQSRFTVAGEIPRTSEVSSIVRPPKNRNSTILLCCWSISASPVKALSSSTTSISN